jgi:hypothetical protein
VSNFGTGDGSFLRGKQVCPVIFRDGEHVLVVRSEDIGTASRDQDVSSPLSW